MSFPECTFDNTNFLGGGLSEEEGGQGLATSSPEECGQECVSRQKCTHWTYVAAWKVNCYLKSRLGEKSEFEGAVSGTYGPDCDRVNGGGGGGAAPQAPLRSQSGGDGAQIVYPTASDGKRNPKEPLVGTLAR